FASDLYDPRREYTLKRFCAEREIRYADSGVPVSLDTFTAYGLSFRDRMVPGLEEKFVVAMDRTADGFVLELDSGEKVKTRRVVLAVGITHFKHTPENLAHLPEEFLTHSFQHHDLELFRD